MRFLIVAPRYITRVGQYYEFPLGLAYISSSLKRAGYQVECLNLNHRNEPLDVLLKNIIVDKEIDVICTGGLSGHFNKVKDIISEAKKIKPDIISIIGGGLLSSEPVLIMEAIKPNIGVIGEGEETIVELADAIANSKDFGIIKSIIYYDSDNNLTTTSKRDPLKDLDSAPYPDYEGFEVDKYLDMQLPNDNYYMYPFDKPRILPLISSRSCPFSCTFCYHPLGKKYRQRSLDGFFKEVEYLIDKYSVNMIAVLDELFSHKKERIKEFCRRMKKYNLKWIAQMRVDSVDEETLLMLKDAGCFYISYGLESASDIVLKSMKKKIKLSQIEKALELTYKNKIGIQGNFIFGDTAETWETANETLDWWLKHRKYQIYLTPIYVYPGSPLFHTAVEGGVIKDKLRYIEIGCPPINLAKVNDIQYGKLLVILDEYVQEYRIPGDVVVCEKKGTDKNRGQLFFIKAKCPHCDSIVEYNNLIQNSLCFFKLACRKCNHKFDLPPFDGSKFYKKIKGRIGFINSQILNKRAGIWGGGVHTRMLLSSNMFSKSNISCIFDNNSAKHGMHVEGIEIVPFSKDASLVKKQVDAIIISSLDSEEDIYEQINYLEDYGIKVYKLYN